MGVGDWLADFIPDEETDPVKMRSWRKRLALVSCSAWLTLFGALIPVLIAVLFTGAPMIGQVAWAEDQDRKVNGKIEAAISPIQKKLESVDSKLNEQSALLAEQVTAALASNICRYNTRRGKELDFEERSRLLGQIQEMRQKYKRYAGIEFDMKDC
jgi:hypothetical protein